MKRIHKIVWLCIDVFVFVAAMMLCVVNFQAQDYVASVWNSFIAGLGFVLVFFNLVNLMEDDE